MNAFFNMACLLALLGGLVPGQTPQPSQIVVAGASSPPLDREVPHYELTDGSLMEGVSELSRNPDVPLHLGSEEIIRERYSDPRDRSVRFALNLEGQTVRQVLNALCGADPRYTWSTNGSSINVYPRARVDDKTYLLNHRIQRIQLNNISTPYGVFKPLSKLFPYPPDQVGYLRMSTANLYSESWTAAFEDLTVRELIDRVAEHIGPRSSWLWQGGEGERAFSFLDGGLP